MSEPVGAKITATSMVRTGDPDADDLADVGRLLGPARMVLDACAEDRPGHQAEAADMAQRIVDLIGHSVTDEPPHALVELAKLRAAMDAMRDFVDTCEAEWQPNNPPCGADAVAFVALVRDLDR